MRTTDFSVVVSEGSVDTFMCRLMADTVVCAIEPSVVVVIADFAPLCTQIRTEPLFPSHSHAL